MSVNDAQVSAQAEVYKPNLDSEEILKRREDLIAQVCSWFGSRFDDFVVGDLRELVREAVGELLAEAAGEDGLAHAVSLILTLKAFFQHCRVFNDFVRNNVPRAIDEVLGVPQGDSKGLKPGIPVEIINRASSMVPSFDELREVVIKAVALGVAKPLTIADLREMAREGKVSALFDARRHRYQVTLKLKNLFTDADAEVIIHISNEKVNNVLKYGRKFDEEPKKGKKGGDEDVNPLFDFVPKVLEPYVGLFLQQGWVPSLSSIEFVKFILEFVNKEQSVYNTTRDELRALLLRALKDFKFASVTYKDGMRLYDPLILSNPKEFMFVDETNGELIAPLRFFTELEVKSGYKSALVNLLVREGLLKAKHTRYTFARKDRPDEKVTLDVAVFNLDKLGELLGFDPRDLMKTEEFDISKLIELSESKAGGGENETQ
jgi:hypothetical protein